MRQLIVTGYFDGEPRDLTGTGEAGPAPKRLVTGYGFWIFLLSDIVMFSALFAVYVVLLNATAGGPLRHPVTIASRLGRPPVTSGRLSRGGVA